MVYNTITLCVRKFTKEIQFSKFLYNFRLLSFKLVEEYINIHLSVSVVKVDLTLSYKQINLRLRKIRQKY